MAKERFLSYSEHYEDVILYNVLKEIKEGFYIDVGANHPWRISVTKGFYNMGWKGINIEPLPKEYSMLCEDRPRDINLNLGIGSKEEKISFLIAGKDSGTSTCDPKIIEKHKRQGYAYEEIIIQVKTLSSVVREYVNTVQPIHFCKVDVEGFEKEVLEGLDLENIRPWIFVIESISPGTSKQKYKEWEEILIKNGYTFSLEEKLNRYYLSKEKESLSNKFLSSKQLMEVYDIYTVIDKDAYLGSYPYRLGQIMLKPLVPIYHLCRPLLRKMK